MSVISVLSAKSAPGVSTSVAALATLWPTPVLVVDADPAGGDLLSGWTGRWWVSGELRSDRNVVSFATATRHVEAVPAEALVGHVQQVPDLDHVQLLTGVTRRAQTDAIGSEGWRRLAYALRDVSDGDADVLVDIGRWEPGTAWPLLSESDLVLLGLRPTLRHVRTATPLAKALREQLPAARVAAAVITGTPRQVSNLGRALTLPVDVQLPDDPDGARVFSDGLTPPAARTPRHRPLLTSARQTARQLHRHPEGHPWLAPTPAQNSTTERSH